MHPTTTQTTPATLAASLLVTPPQPRLDSTAGAFTFPGTVTR